MGIARLFKWIQEQLNHPLRILWFCAGLAFLNLFVDGSLLKLWNLHQDYRETQSKTTELETLNAEMDEKLRRASDPLFIEREARDRFDLVNEGDLVFVFADDDEVPEETPN
ncbi:MAG: septum formation initiator family protein [Bdellovibrionales bacterium]|nr:septum formation initiator family protein [Bdellovibrionales bacterium]